MILAALAAASTLAAPLAPTVLGTGDVSVEAGTVVYDGTRRRYRIEGGAVLRRGVVVLRARTAELDPATGEVTASGGVLLTDATRAVAAEGLRAVLGGAFEADGVVAYLKDGPVDLGAAVTLEAARALGVNRLSLSARRVRGGADPADHLAVEGARLTLCDCGPGEEPSWSLRARAADVVPGVRATLSWPVLHVRPPFANRSWPVLPLPWLYVPLGDRQTGLLFPEVESTRATGLAGSAPVFVTLGDHADMTLVPGWAFGRSRAPADDSAAVRGPTGRLELRWAPAVRAEGRAELLWVKDEIAEPKGASGHRFAFALQHHQGAADGLALAADASLASDGVLHRDLTSDALLRTAPYRRSSLLLGRLAGPALVEAGSSYLQPLQPDGAVGAYGFAGADVDLANPLAWASATLPASALGPLLVSGRAGVSRLSPVHGGGDLAGRPGVTRLDGRLEVEAPFLLGGAVAFSPFLRGAALAYPGAPGGGGEATAWAVLGAAASAEVSRAFGSLRHAVGARAEWRLGTPAAGAAPAFPAFDALDRVRDREALPGERLLTTAPEGRFQQLRLALDTRLSRGGRALVRLSAGQDVDLAAGRASDAFVLGGLSWGAVRAELSARFPGPGAPRRASAGEASLLDGFSELRAAFGVGDRRGSDLHASLVSIGTWAPGTQLAGLDVLFDPRLAAVGPISQASAGGQLALGGARLGYDVLFPGRGGVATAACGAGAPLSALEIQQHAATLTWDSPCRCFRAAVRVTVDACGNVSGLSGKLEIARLGERASVR